jgi:hypothetical protein
VSLGGNVKRLFERETKKIFGGKKQLAGEKKNLAGEKKTNPYIN